MWEVPTGIAALGGLTGSDAVAIGRLGSPGLLHATIFAGLEAWLDIKFPAASPTAVGLVELAAENGAAQLDGAAVLSANVAAAVWSQAASHALGAWMSHRINVKLMGAVGNGIADDTQAFLAAFAQALRLNVGVLIEVPAGRYRLSQTIAELLTSNQSIYLKGDGQTSTILDFRIPAAAANFSGFDITLGDGATVRGFKNTACPSLTLSGVVVGARACTDPYLGDNGFYVSDLTIQTNSPANRVFGNGVLVTGNEIAYDILSASATVANVSFMGGAPTDGNRSGEAPGCSAWKYPVHFRNLFTATASNLTIQGGAADRGCNAADRSPTGGGWADGAGVLVEAPASYGAQSQGIVVTGSNIKYYNIGVALSGVQQGDTVSGNSFFGDNYGVAIGGGVPVGGSGTTQFVSASGSTFATSFTVKPAIAATLTVGEKIDGGCLPYATISAINITIGVISFASLIGNGGQPTTTASIACDFTNETITVTNGDILFDAFGSGGLTISGNGFDTTLAGVWAPVDPSTFIGFSGIAVAGNSFLQNTSAAQNHVDVRLDKGDSDVVRNNTSMSPHGPPVTGLDTTQFLVAHFSYGNHGPVVTGNMFDTSGSIVPAIQFSNGIGNAVVDGNTSYGNTIFASDDSGPRSSNYWGCHDVVGSTTGTRTSCGLYGVGSLADMIGLGGRWEADRAAAGVGSWHGVVFGSAKATTQGVSANTTLTPAGGANALPTGITAAAASAAGSYSLTLSAASTAQIGMTVADSAAAAAIPGADTIMGLSGSTATVGPYPIASPGVASGNALTFGYGQSLEIAGNVYGAVTNGLLDGIARCHSSDGGQRFDAEVTADYQNGIMSANVARVILTTNPSGQLPSGVALIFTAVLGGKPQLLLQNRNTTPWTCHGLLNYVPD